MVFGYSKSKELELMQFILQFYYRIEIEIVSVKELRKMPKAKCHRSTQRQTTQLSSKKLKETLE